MPIPSLMNFDLEMLSIVIWGPPPPTKIKKKNEKSYLLILVIKDTQNQFLLVCGCFASTGRDLVTRSKFDTGMLW